MTVAGPSFGADADTSCHASSQRTFCHRMSDASSDCRLPVALADPSRPDLSSRSDCNTLNLH